MASTCSCIYLLGISTKYALFNFTARRRAEACSYPPSPHKQDSRKARVTGPDIFLCPPFYSLLPAYCCDLGDTPGSPTIWDYFLLHCIVVPSLMPATCTAYIHKTEKDFIDCYKTMLRMASTLPKARPILEANYDTAS